MTLPGLINLTVAVVCGIIALALALTLTMSARRKLSTTLRDWRMHGKRTWCLIVGHVQPLTYIGQFAKPGYRPAPLHQCRRCAEFVLRHDDLTRLGGKTP